MPEIHEKRKRIPPEMSCEAWTAKAGWRPSEFREGRNVRKFIWYKDDLSDIIIENFEALVEIVENIVSNIV